ncbi:MAG: CapA family protein [Dysgonamonadaceae bacterium]|jgi:poly-gamma-glutamate synthesis protein (capsule biosynthesis protein)|nr:CapA family protein [Dysgonamonadaceae bacterium]
MGKALLLFFVVSGLLSPAYAQELTLLFAGDAMQHQTQIDNAYRGGIYDYSSCFKHLKAYISEADVAVVNLEVTLGGKPYTGYPMFSAPDEYAAALKEAGFDVFLTANNHSLDRRKKGLERTIRVLDSLEVRHLGTYVDREEKAKNYPIIWTEKGIRVAFLNYTYGTNGIHVTPPNVVNYIDTTQIKNDIRNARGALGADVIIACVHWGMEYKLVQNPAQEQLAGWMVREGVDLIIGSHPHVVQPAQVWRNEQGEITNLVIYSLGNFISGMTQVNTNGGQIVKVVLSKEDFHTKIKSCSYRLIYVDKQKNGNKLDYTLLPVDAFENRKDSLSTVSYNPMTTFAKNARSLFAKYNEEEIREAP